MPRQNLILNSETLAPWSLSQATVVLAGDSHPLGAVVSRLFEDAVNSYHYALAGFGRPDGTAVTIGDGVVFTFAADLKFGNYGYGSVQLNGSAFIVINLATAAVIIVGGAGYLGHSITPLGDGWYRVSITSPTIGGAHAMVQTSDAAGNTLHIGNPANYILVARCQVTATKGPVAVHAPTTATLLVKEGTPRGRVPRQNLALHSEAFDNATWTKQAGAVVTANDAVAPDGSMTADKIDLTATAVNQGVFQAGLILPIGSTACASVWVKGTAGQTINMANPNGTLSSPTFTFDGTWQRIHLAELPTSIGLFGVWLRKGTANVFWAWGAQVTPTKTPAPYVATTTTSVNEGAPRGRMPRQNLLSLTSSLSVGWATGNVTRAASGTGPMGETAHRLTSSSAAVVEHNFYTPLSTLSVGAVVTYSFYAKAGTHSYVYLRDAGWVFTYFDLATGTCVGGTGSDLVARGIEPAGNGWYRCWMAFKSVQAGTDYFVIGMGSSNNVAVSIPVGLYVDISSPQRTYTKSLAVYSPNESSAMLDEGTPRGQMPLENVLAYSEDTSNAFWAKGNVTVGALVTAPDGSLSAYQLFETAANAQHNLTRVVTTDVVQGRVYTVSVFAKKIATGRDVLLIAANSNTGVYYDIVLGVCGNVFDPSGNIKGYGMEPAGNGWWRLWMTCAYVAVGVANTIRFEPAVSLGGTTVYVGDPTNSMAYWGLQLTESNNVAPYVKTSGIAALEGAPRGRSPRENLILRSNTFNSWATKTSVVVVDNAALAPDGTMTAATIADNSDNNIHMIAGIPPTQATNKVVTFSFYAKAGTATTGIIALNDALGYCNINFTTGVISSPTPGNIVSFGSEPVGNGWFRYWLTAQQEVGRSYRIYVGQTVYVGSGSFFYLWHAQMTDTLGPTDYVDTSTHLVMENSPRAL